MNPTVKTVDVLVPIKTAFISVSDQTDLDELVLALVDRCPGIRIISSDETYSAIEKILGPDLTAKHLIEVSNYTGQVEIEDDVVKNLSHKLFMGYLTDLNNFAQSEDMKRQNVLPVDLVVVNFRPFEKIFADGVDYENIRRNIDVGRLAALLSAATNFLRVMAISNPSQYDKFLDRLAVFNGKTSFQHRFNEAKKSFQLLYKEYAAIFGYFESKSFENVENSYTMVTDLF